MPYKIEPVKKGFKVCESANPDVCFSKQPLSKKRAQAQRVAIALSSAKREHKPVSAFFV